MQAVKDVVRIAAVGDLHYSRTATQGSLQPDDGRDLEAAGDLTRESARVLERA